MDLICFSHLRWNFVYQRPQHLMSRFTKYFRVFFIEEPVIEEKESFIECNTNEQVHIVVPHLGAETLPGNRLAVIRSMLHELVQLYNIEKYIAWFYTPMAIEWYRSMPPAALIIYDCMDELSLFKNAPAHLTAYEMQLLQTADLVFTGGYGLYEAKRNFHPAVFPFPSSIDKEHFGRARAITTDPPDQQNIPHPRIGFFGVIDERFDAALIGEAASLRPHWQFVIVGPVVKIDPAILPQAQNITYTGNRHYNELPSYLGGWDAAMIPFAINDSTKFISPTKTPEYLAGGVPVVSTPVTDVIRLYGNTGLVYIADGALSFVAQLEQAVVIKNDPSWKRAVDNYLSTISWDVTWEKMMFEINTKLENKKQQPDKTQLYV